VSLGPRAAALLLGALALAGCAAPADPSPSTSAPGLAPACPERASTVPFAMPDLDEASGLARSGRLPCLLWVHEDSGAMPLLHATDAAGAHLGTLRLDAPAMDWEDLASFTLDGMPHLLVGDVGNNGLDRPALAFVVLPEPDVAAWGMPFDRAAEGVRVVAVRVEGPPINVEAVAVDAASGEVLLVAKGGAALAANAAAGPDQALYTAPLADVLRGAEVTLTFRTIIPGIRPGPGDAPGEAFLLGLPGGAATAMDLHPDGLRLALLTYREVLVWERAPGQPWAEALRALPRALPVPAEGAQQMEAIAFSADGAWLFVGAERGEPRSMLTAIPFP
jgi:hypothetical protein